MVSCNKHAFVFAAVIFACGSGTLLSGQPKHIAQKRVVVPVKSPVQCLLERRVRHVAWDEHPFGEILSWLRKLSPKDARVHVLPRWSALRAEGVDRDSPITLEMHNATVSAILEEVLDQLSLADPLTYVGKDRKLRITTQSDVRKRLTTETYDVAELLAQVRAGDIQPQFFIGQSITFVEVTVTRAGVGVQPRQLDVGGSFFGTPPQQTQQNDDNNVDDTEYEAQLIEWIQNTVEPDTWQINGGPGTLAIFDGVLSVRNSADVHALLGGRYFLNR